MLAAASHFGGVLIGEDFRFVDRGPVFRLMRGAWAQRVDCIGGHHGIYGGSMIPVDRKRVVLPAGASVDRRQE